MNNFAPNYTTNDKKGLYLGYAVRKLLFTKLGIN